MADISLDIATGNSRKTKTWKNSQMLWSELVNRLKTTTKTPETVAEYKAMGKQQQSEIKDVGGFVGGYCNNGRRSDIRHRSILCLDADFADSELWPDFVSLIGTAAVVYSTHKHTPDKPRLRLVIPFSRTVAPDEYQAIGRKVAAVIGIDKFDDSSYQPQRMMYWPSTSQDGEYFFQVNDGPLLDPDAILATYHDWRDISSWPMSSRVSTIIKRSEKKQQDPTTKSGLVGAFCRAYTIHEAIAAYVPTYTSCDVPGRYTYTEGSTAAGVVTYDDRYSYSHHATDPASGQLCNAWDLVRLHRFGHLDIDCDPDIQPSRRPSYKDMSQLALEDDRVKIQLVDDRMAEAVEDYSSATDDGDEWKSKLMLTGKGGLAQSINNVVTVLKHDPKLAGCVGLNEMTHQIVLLSPPPWGTAGEKGRAWNDSDDAELRFYLEKEYGLSGKDRIFDAVNVVAQDHRFHPVRDYLDGCDWDGAQRLDTLLIDYLGAEDSQYTRAVTRKTLAAAVARIYTPGCKFDYMLVLRGAQGIGKSHLVRRLGGKWFSDSFMTLQGKDAYEQVQGVWLMEIGELAGMKKAETETIKLFISKQIDRFRPAYGRRTQEFKRQCIFIGTTNETQFLRDATGNRRFWVVDTPNDPKKDIWELDQATIDQIWGEAVQAYKSGEELFLPRELEVEARRVQSEYEEENPRAGLIQDYLDRLLPENWYDLDLYSRREWLASSAEGTRQREFVSVVEIWAEALDGDPVRIDRYIGADIRGIMARLPSWRGDKGYRPRLQIYGQQRVYRRVTDDAKEGGSDEL